MTTAIDNTLNPIRSHQPILAFDQIPDNAFGNDGEVCFVGGVLVPGMYRKVQGVWTFWNAVGSNPASNSPVVLGLGAGTGATGTGVNTSAITANNGGTYPAQMQAVNVPANSMGKNGQLDIQFAVTTTNSAGVKTLAINFGGQQIFSIALSNLTSRTGTVRVRNAGALNSQIVTVLDADGQSTAAFKTVAVDTSIDQIVQFFGSTVVANDAIALTGYNVQSIFAPNSQSAYPPLMPGKKVFYGVNNHPAYEISLVPPDLQIRYMKYLNATVLRLDFEGNNLPQIQAYARAFQVDGSGLQICCCIGNTSMEASAGVAYANELAAYNANYTNAYNAALALIPYGITLFEAGNEMDAATVGGTPFRPTISSNGANAADFTASIFPLFRGALNGATDGLRAAAAQLKTKILVASNAFTNASIAVADALWNGTNLDGTPGFQPNRWDVTNWHTYAASILSAAYSGVPPPTFNLAQYLNVAYGGRPIIITEFNSDPTTVASWLNLWYTNQAKYNIAAVMFYDLFDTPFNMFNAANQEPDAASNITAVGAAYRNFILANPAQR